MSLPNQKCLIGIICGIVFLLIGGVIALSVISFYPKPSDVYINSLTVSNFNVSNNTLTAKWDLQLQLRNSKKSFHYEEVSFYLRYGRDTHSYYSSGLAYTRIKPFDQVKGTKTMVNATLVSDIYVEDRLADLIKNERVTKGSVEFDLYMFYSISKIGPSSRRSFIKLYCNDVTVGVPASSSFGKMLGPSKRFKYF